MIFAVLNSCENLFSALETHTLRAFFKLNSVYPQTEHLPVLSFSVCCAFYPDVTPQAQTAALLQVAALNECV